MKTGKIALVAVGLLAFAAPLSAQIRAQISPFYGYVLPQGDLPASFALTKTDGTSVDIAGGAFESKTPVYGATIGVQLLKGLLVEGTLLTGNDQLTADRMVPADTKILAYSGGLALDLPKYWRAQPFLIGGAGVKSYDFDIAGTKTKKNYEYNFGAGLNLEVTKNVALTFQARDLYSTFNSALYGVANETQNDVLLAGGLTLKFGFGGQSGVAAIQH